MWSQNTHIVELQLLASRSRLGEPDFCAALQVLMKDIVTPVPQEDVKSVIRKCLEQAALVNYQRLSEYAKIEGR